LRHAHLLQRRGPAVAPIEELPVGQPEIAVDDRLPVCVQPAGTAGEVQRRQWRFHDPIVTAGRGPDATLGEQPADIVGIQAAAEHVARVDDAGEQFRLARPAPYARRRTG